MQYPYHDEAAIETACAIVRAWNPDEIVLLGDCLDCAPFTGHSPITVQDACEDFLGSEVAPMNQLLDRIGGRKERPIVYIAGNHEHRVERYLAAKAGKVGETILRAFNPEALLRHRVDAAGRPHTTRKRFTWIPYIGKGFHTYHHITPNLIALHGWSFAQNAAKIHLDAARCYSVVFGHVHRRQSVTLRNPINGDLYTAWSPGCLASFVPDYSAHQPNTWSHGVSQIYTSKRDPRDWTKFDVEIRNGRAILDSGKEVRAA